jgi:hypothetical protein
MKNIYTCEGKEVGAFDGKKFHITNGTDWIVNGENNVYEEGDDGGGSYKGRLDGDVIISITGEVQFTLDKQWTE